MMWTALLLGVGGSLHCAAMCSPLAMAITSFNKHTLLNRLIYNTGRVLVYGLLGFTFASLGSLIDLSAFQSILSICLGALLILLGVGAITKAHIPLFTKFVNQFIVFIKKRFTFLLQQKNYKGLFAMGMLNGILPCGLTYLAASYTITLSSAWHGFLFMIVFGLGTIPAMIGLPYLFKVMTNYFQFRLSKVTTVLMISLGILLIARSFIPHYPTIETSAVPTTDITICR
jgi:uncharacterized protein